MTVVNKAEFAAIIGKSPKWVGELIEKGMPATGGGGRGVQVKIDSVRAIEWLIQHELGKHIDLDDTEGGSSKKDSEDIALKRTRREVLEHKLKQMRLEVVPINTVTDIVLQFASIWSSSLDGLSSRVCGVIAGMTDAAEIRQVLHGETRQIRASTADSLRSAIHRIAGELSPDYGTDTDIGDQFPADEDSL